MKAFTCEKATKIMLEITSCNPNVKSKRLRKFMVSGLPHPFIWFYPPEVSFTYMQQQNYQKHTQVLQGCH